MRRSNWNPNNARSKTNNRANIYSNKVEDLAVLWGDWYKRVDK